MKEISARTVEELNTTAGHGNEIILRQWLRQWGQNLAENLRLHHIKWDTAETVHQFYGSANQKAAIICGAGPSLDANLAELAKHKDVIQSDNVVFFAGPSTFPNVLAAGLKPHFVVAYDASPITYQHFDTIPTDGMDLLTTVHIHPATIIQWQNNKKMPPPLRTDGIFWFAQNSGECSRIANSMFRFIPPVVDRGCIVSAQMILAMLFGCPIVYMVGCDMGFTGGKSRANKVIFLENQRKQTFKYLEPVSHQEEIAKKPVTTVKDVHGKDILTWAEMLRYRTSLYFTIWDDLRSNSRPNFRVYNMTGNGILTAIPMISIESGITAMATGVFPTDEYPKESPLKTTSAGEVATQGANKQDGA